jgi:hypothetical protein
VEVYAGGGAAFDVFLHAVGGQGDDGAVETGLELGQQVDAVAVGEADVADDDIDGGELGGGFSGFGDGLGGVDLVAARRRRSATVSSVSAWSSTRRMFSVRLPVPSALMSEILPSGAAILVNSLSRTRTGVLRIFGCRRLLRDRRGERPRFRAIPAIV